MSGDYSRFVFDPTLDYHGVQLQQGRPLTDWDWNDATAQINRRQQADSYDTLGQAVVPSTTKDAFAIKLSGSSFTIGPGRMYVDGLLAENHGTGTLAWDPALAEQVGTGWYPYEKQPYYPNPPALPAPGGLNLVYLDVWQREVSWIEAPALVEPALGVDTTTRIQTVWQVKVLANVDSGTTCDTPLGQVKGWSDLTAPTAGLLSTATGAPTSNDPCQIPPAGGYKGLENQLYRIEIHDGGAIGKATFKWSRNNASVVANVTKLIDTKTLVVDSVGRDSVLRFNDGDWVEITDDWRELNNLPGEMHQIVIGGGVDDATRTITLTTAINASWFPSGTLKDRHTRLKRWDQQGKVLNADGTLYIDLDTTTNGLIPVPKAGKQIALESGILISFDLATSGGAFKSGDYWMVAARAATADIDHLTKAPPRGIHHHYAKLGYTTLTGTPQDCRVFWPPAAGGDGCSCTMCVTPNGHNSGTATIQQAITHVIKNGGGTVCLEPGTYNLTSTINIVSAPSLRIRGQGPATQLVASVTQAFNIDTGGDLGFRDFSLQLAATSGTAPAASTGFTFSSVITLDMTGLIINSAVGVQNSTDTAIQFNGHTDNATVRACNISTATGIAALHSEGDKGYYGSILRITDNLFACKTIAVNAPQMLSTGALLVQCCGNSVQGASDAGFRFGAGESSLGRIEVARNRIQASGCGIVCNLGGMDIHDNEIHYVQNTQQGATLLAGIAIGDVQNPTQTPVDDLRLFGNRISDYLVGIAGLVPVGNALVKSNRLEKVGMGIAFTAAGTGALSIENNQLADITGYGAGGAALVFGIAVAGAACAQIRDNSLARLGMSGAGTIYAEAIYVGSCNQVAIDGNAIVDLVPQKDFKGAALAITINYPFTDAAVRDNQISRSSVTTTDTDSGLWSAISISGTAPVSAALVSTDVKAANVKAAATKTAKKTAAKAAALAVNSLPSQVLRANIPSVLSKVKMPTQLATNLGASIGTIAGTNAAATPTQRGLLRGNQVNGFGGNTLVEAQGLTDCDCSGNQCLTLPVPGVEPSMADVVLAAMTLVVNGNRIQGTSFSLALATPNKTAAVIANITTGRIQFDGGSLPSPWSTLNVTGV